MLDISLDELLGLDVVDDLQYPVLDDCLDLPGQQDVLYSLYDDIGVDDLYVVDVKIVLLTLDDLVVLDDDDPVVNHCIALFPFP